MPATPLNRSERRTAAKASRARDDGRALLDPHGAATYLGVCRETVYRIIDAGHLRAFKVGKAWRIRPSDLDAYLDEHVAS
jgi:excisionase family DNA binding protein